MKGIRPLPPTLAADFSLMGGLAVVRKTPPLLITFTVDHHTRLDIEGTKEEPTPIKSTEGHQQTSKWQPYGSSLEAIPVE